MTQRINLPRSLSLLGCLLPLGLLAVGCGASGPKTAEVSGEVTYKGKPVPLGTIAFLSDSGAVDSSEIRDGKYTLHRAPQGAVKITVVSAAPMGAPGNPMMQKISKVKMTMGDKSGAAVELPKGGLKIPARYRDPQKTDLTYTVTSSKTQTHNVELTD